MILARLAAASIIWLAVSAQLGFASLLVKIKKSLPWLGGQGRAEWSIVSYAISQS